MPTEMKLWRIADEQPKVLTPMSLDLESRLEEWLRKDIGLISNDLLVIGQQVPTSYGGSIDLLAIDSVGNLVVLELKRDKTPRDTVAQLLDYGSWVQDLDHEEIENIASEFLDNTSLEDAFQENFQIELPEVLNERHRLYLVAASLDAASERIVKYLSETHDVDINAATFTYWNGPNGELLGRLFLLDEEDVQTRAVSKSKRKPPRSWEELRSLAEHHGVQELYDKSLNGLQPIHDSANRTRTNVALVGIMGETKARNTIISIYPEASSRENGLALLVYLDRVAEYFSIPLDDVKNLFGEPATNATTWAPGRTFFCDSNQLDRVINVLSTAKQQ